MQISVGSSMPSTALTEVPRNEEILLKMAPLYGRGDRI
jgi:hypothetical protein